MIIVGGELWITARESASRAGYVMTLTGLQRFGRRAARMARSEGLSPVLAVAPPDVPWPTEYFWPERIWQTVAWDLWAESGQWRLSQ